MITAKEFGQLQMEGRLSKTAMPGISTCDGGGKKNGVLVAADKGRREMWRHQLLRKSRRDLGGQLEAAMASGKLWKADSGSNHQGCFPTTWMKVPSRNFFSNPSVTSMISFLKSCISQF